MLHRGSRDAENGDYFEDFNEAGPAGKEKGGVFGGLGLDYYENLRENLVPEGLRIQMACRSCGLERVLTISWEELTIAATNGPGVSILLPQGWAVSPLNGAMHPNTPCPGSCRGTTNPGVFAPLITPSEAEEHVKTALSQGFVSQQDVGQWVRTAQQFRAGHR